MAKPWAKIEQNYINHPKFLALNANAICLWHEAKNYCDMHITDGFFPREALKTFRFNGQRAVELLTRSCGSKPNGQTFAPLWDRIDVGGVPHFRMHDYLDHNDCRDEVLERLQDADDKAELRKAANAERQRKFRADRKAQLEALRNAGGNAVTGVTSRAPTEAATETASASKAPKKQEPKSGGSKRPIYQSDRFVVFEWQLEEIERILGPHFLDFDCHQFFNDLSERLRIRGLVIPADQKARWQWLLSQVQMEAERRGLSVAGTMRAAGQAEWICPHETPCLHPSPCLLKQRIAAEKAKAS